MVCLSFVRVGFFVLFSVAKPKAEQGIVLLERFSVLIWLSWWMNPVLLAVSISS